MINNKDAVNSDKEILIRLRTFIKCIEEKDMSMSFFPI